MEPDPKTPAIILKDATESDIAAAVDIQWCWKLSKQKPDLPPATIPVLKQENQAGMSVYFREAIQQKTKFFRVAEVDGIPVGFSVFKIGHADGGEKAELESLFVHPAFQNQGIGKILMNDAIEACAEKGCEEIGLACDDSDDALKAWYAGFGAESLPETFDYPGGAVPVFRRMRVPLLG